MCCSQKVAKRWLSTAAASFGTPITMALKSSRMPSIRKPDLSPNEATIRGSACVYAKCRTWPSFTSYSFTLS